MDFGNHALVLGFMLLEPALRQYLPISLAGVSECTTGRLRVCGVSITGAAKFRGAKSIRGVAAFFGGLPPEDGFARRADFIQAPDARAVGSGFHKFGIALGLLSDGLSRRG